MVDGGDRGGGEQPGQQPDEDAGEHPSDGTGTPAAPEGQPMHHLGPTHAPIVGHDSEREIASVRSMAEGGAVAIVAPEPDRKLTTML